jgi:hypothetical protein
MGGDENINKIDEDINCKINDEQIKELFIVSSKFNESENILKNDNSKESFSDKTTTTYKNNMIPGYILTPVLKTMSQNIYSNEYYINID